MSASHGDVGEITVLTNQPNHKEALILLRTLHSLVKPIMKAHSWYLPKLAEFFPSQSHLLGVNVNRGQKICIRLRPHDDPHSFYSLEDTQTALIGTMLHELTHNHRGPHDEVFYAYLDKLQDEYELLRKTYSGEGFLSVMGAGTKLGGAPPKNLRDARAKAADARQSSAKLMGIGGRLGGVEIKGKTRSEILADAADRRIRDAKGCRNQDLSPEMLAEIAKAERDSKGAGGTYLYKSRVNAKGEIEILDDDDDDDDDGDVEIVEVVEVKYGSGKHSVKGKEKAVIPAKRPLDATAPKVKRTIANPALASSSKSRTWQCGFCTFENSAVAALICSICQSGRVVIEIEDDC